MKLLLDQNLSHRLVSLLAVEYPGSEHVRKIGLEREVRFHFVRKQFMQYILPFP